MGFKDLQFRATKWYLAEDVDKKFEAINTHMTKWVSGHSDWQMGRMSQWKKELDEILEAA